MPKVIHVTAVNTTKIATLNRHFFILNYQPFIKYWAIIPPIKKRVKLFKTTITSAFSTFSLRRQSYGPAFAAASAE
jgi:hypothetical protein